MKEKKFLLGIVMITTFISYYSIGQANVLFSTPKEKQAVITDGKANDIENKAEKGILASTLEWFTSVDHSNPRSVIGAEIPLLSFNDASLAYDDGKGRYIDPPMESNPPSDWSRDAVKGEEQPKNEESQKNVLKIEKLSNDRNQSKNQQLPQVLIYHTHNRESYLPMLKGITNPNEAYNSKINVTLVGKHLGEALKQYGVESIISDKDYAKIVPSFVKSYAYSLKTVKSVMADHHSIQYLFDIHRDSQPRSKTTININGKSYAQIYIIVGKQNPHWKENYQLALKLHQKMEVLYPGLSKSIYTKAEGNGEYNQSVTPNSLLIEVGGVGNNLDELNRTAEAMAKVISEIVKDATKVDAAPAGKPEGSKKG